MKIDTLMTLIEARRLIESGWIQYEARNRKGHCLSGALFNASGCLPGEITSEAYQEAVDLVRSVIFEPKFGGALMLWNDADGRTKADVLDALDQAIATTMLGNPQKTFSLGKIHENTSN
jgi:hypothetical protein